MSFVRQHKGAVLWSLALHLAVVAGLVIGVPWSEQRPRVSMTAAPIQGTIVDQAAIEREKKAREEAARQERQRQQREERQRREAADQQRQAEQREQQRVAAEQRARTEAEQKERERVAAEKAAQERREEQAREREAQAQRDREAAEKRSREQAEQRRRQQAESELSQQLALEAEANAARAAGLLDQYIAMIENRIKQKWDKPLSAGAGIDCIVNVVQLPSGDVMSAQVASCNGDDAVRRSIERAVMDASPLPKPPNPALFQRNLRVNFKPDE
jgi:colicin import membrane protein